MTEIPEVRYEVRYEGQRWFYKYRVYSNKWSGRLGMEDMKGLAARTEEKAIENAKASEERRLRHYNPDIRWTSDNREQ